MTLTADPPTAADSAPRDSTRRTALIAGTLYLITFVASIPAFALYGPSSTTRGMSSGPDPTSASSGAASSR